MFWVLHCLPVRTCKKKKKKLHRTNSELKITAENISCMQQKHSPAYPSDLDICEFNLKLALLAFGLDDT